MADEATVQARQRWMAVLAKTERQEIECAWRDLGAAPAFTHLRRPETGLVMVRARAGGDGSPFNMGEMTVTRCSVRLDNGIVGHAYVAGRDPRHAELAAVADALMQDPTRRAAVQAAIIEPLAAAQCERRKRAARKAAATRVDFFTLVRGED